jgi:hypothetical protein
VKLKGHARYSNGIDTQVKKYWLLISNGLRFSFCDKREGAESASEKLEGFSDAWLSVQGIG